MQFNNYQIPQELFIHHIFPYLYDVELLELRLVCKEMKELIEKDPVWKERLPKLHWKALGHFSGSPFLHKSKYCKERCGYEDDRCFQEHHYQFRRIIKEKPFRMPKDNFFLAYLKTLFKRQLIVKVKLVKRVKERQKKLIAQKNEIEEDIDLNKKELCQLKRKVNEIKSLGEIKKMKLNFKYHKIDED